ncbi:MAG: hypothetical protein WC483_03200 [Candidatus Paceibacterota bacterium]
MKNNKLNIKTILAPIITSRDAINKLEKMVKKMPFKTFELDFSDVEFISRSAAHELLVMKEKLAHRLFFKKDIIINNTNFDVSEMIRVVAANRAVPKKIAEKMETKIVSFDEFLKHNLSLDK